MKYRIKNAIKNKAHVNASNLQVWLVYKSSSSNNYYAFYMLYKNAGIAGFSVKSIKFSLIKYFNRATIKCIRVLSHNHS